MKMKCSNFVKKVLYDDFQVFNNLGLKEINGLIFIFKENLKKPVMFEAEPNKVVINTWFFITGHGLPNGVFIIPIINEDYFIVKDFVFIRWILMYEKLTEIKIKFHMQKKLNPGSQASGIGIPRRRHYTLQKSKMLCFNSLLGFQNKYKSS
ncbi:hypothetical protein [Aquiflexum sp.]|uniref:hypothetical protein n=1 Tax=Aquiflexum sp. TaxID=1872584 RepID=UPI00359462E0